VPRLLLPLFALVSCSSEPSTPIPDDGAALPAHPCLDHTPLPPGGALLSAEIDAANSQTPESLQAVVDLLDLSGIGPFNYAIDGWLIRYETQDRGAPAEATGVVFVPQGVEGPLDVVVWLNPSLGANNECAPSSMGVAGNGLAMIFASRMGVAVVTPDYLGRTNGAPGTDDLHPYIVAEPVAVSTLDMVRAAESLAEQEGFALRTDQLVLWGVSQGGHAALWTDLYQTRYAPELGIAGVVAVVPPTDIEAIARRASTTMSRASEAFPSVAVSMADWYGLNADEVLPPGLADSVREVMATSCEVLDPAGDVDAVDGLFTDAVRDGTYGEDWACAFESSRPSTSHLTPSGAPILMPLGGEDDVVFSDIARDEAQALCDAGAQIALVECIGLDHEDAALSTVFQQEDWVLDRFAGVPVAEGCDLPLPVTCPPLPID
jgi:acetyl esterase/lipase